MARMSAPASTVRPAAPFSRIDQISQALLPIIFGIGWTALVGVSAYQWIRYAPPGDQPLAVRIGLACFFLAGPVWILVRHLRAFPKRPPRSLTSSVALAASVAVFLAWLAHDDEEWRHSERHPALRNDSPEAAATHALALRYTEDAPGSLLSSLPAREPGFPSTEPGPRNDAEWADFIAENGPAIDALWIDLAPLRAWLDELAAAPALGDLGDDSNSPSIGSKALHLASHIACARSLRLAADGRRDEAVETLLPVLDASRKLEPHARTLMRRLIAIALRRQAQNTLGRILDGGALSPGTRDRLAAALAPRPDVAEQARLLVLSEYETIGRLLIRLDANRVAARLPDSEDNRKGAAPLLHLILPFAYNPRRSANLAGDRFGRLADAAARRDLATIVAADSRRFSEYGNILPGKNFVGRVALAMTTPAFQRIVEHYWATDDQRAALLARINN
jgi:hypothetical protein